MMDPNKLLVAFRRPEYDMVFKFYNMPHHNVLIYHKDNYMTFDVAHTLQPESFKMWTHKTECGDKCNVCKKSAVSAMQCAKCGDSLCQKCKTEAILADALSKNPKGMIRCSGCNMELPYTPQKMSAEDIALKAIRKEYERVVADLYGYDHDDL